MLIVDANSLILICIINTKELYQVNSACTDIAYYCTKFLMIQFQKETGLTWIFKW